MKKTALVVCPGRGTYNKAELGYISQHANDSTLLAQFDAVRSNAGLATVTELDNQSVFSRSTHLKAENAAALIFAAGMVDYRSINSEQFEVVAVTGNSMGWYTALGCAGVLAADSGMQLVTDMAQLTAGGAGAQFIYPVIDDNWQSDAERAAHTNLSPRTINRPTITGTYKPRAKIEIAITPLSIRARVERPI